MEFNDPRIDEILFLTLPLVIFGLILLLIYSIYKCLKNKRATFSLTLITIVKEKLFWNAIIRTSLQSYLRLAVTISVAISLLKWTDICEKVLTVIICILTVGCLSLPIFYFFLLKLNWARAKELSKKIGSLYLGIKIKNPLAFFYSIFFLVRRLIFALITYLLIKNKGLLFLAFFALNLLQGIYLVQVWP